MLYAFTDFGGRWGGLISTFRWLQMFDRLVDDCFLMFTLEGGQLTVDLSGVQQCREQNCNEEVETPVVTNYQQISGLRHPLYAGVRVVLDNN